MKLNRKTKRLELSEREIEQQIVDLLTAHGWTVDRNNHFLSGNAVVVQGTTEKGKPDLMARKRVMQWLPSASNCALRLPGYWLVHIEVKQPGKEPSKAQSDWHWTAAQRGEKVIIAHGIEDVECLI